MKTTKKILSIILVITMVISIFSVTASAETASGACGDNLTWTFEGSTLTISGTGEMRSNATRYCWYAYKDSIVTVVIENGVTLIEMNAFFDCPNIESVKIPVSVKKINKYAFFVEDYVNFKGFYYEGTISQWQDIDLGELNFSGNHPYGQTTVHCECESGDFKYEVVSETEKTIKITKCNIYQANINCSNPIIIKTIKIPSEIDGYTVTEIGDYAFRGIDYVSNIELPSTVTKIGKRAFRGCEELNSINLPDGVTTIGDYAFAYCRSLTGIRIPDGVTAINDYVFYDCDNLNKIVIPDSVKSIGVYSFRSCNGLETVIIGDGVITIDEYAFQECYNLKEIIIPDNVTTIGSYAFYDCESLKEFEIPDSVKTIGDYAFFNSNVLPTINLPASLISIGKVAFNVQAITVDSENPYFSSDDGVLFNKDKTTLIQYPVANNRESYIVPDSVKSIGYCAFYNCDGIKEIIIPESVKTISYHAFRDCDNLKEIIIPDSVTTIGKYAFYDCDNLETVIIPDGVTTIGEFAFGYCNNLTDVYYDGTEEQWEVISIGRNNSGLTNATIHFDHKNNHTPADGVTGVYTAPTCTEKGYTTYTCGICGIEYKDDYVNETGHIDSDNDGICDQCNRNPNTSTSTPDSDILGISGIFSIFNIIIELFEKIFSLFGFMKV